MTTVDQSVGVLKAFFDSLSRRTYLVVEDARKYIFISPLIFNCLSNKRTNRYLYHDIKTHVLRPWIS